MNGFGEGPDFWSSDHPTPSEIANRETPFKNFGSSMNAISLGFLATAILISMFLIMAIFEHLLQPRPSVASSHSDAEGTMEMGEPRASLQSLGKLRNSRPVVTPYTSDFSVVMPGQLHATYIAQPAPLPCPREEMHWPSHDHLPPLPPSSAIGSDTQICVQDSIAHALITMC